MVKLSLVLVEIGLVVDDQRKLQQLALGEDFDGATSSAVASIHVLADC